MRMSDSWADVQLRKPNIDSRHTDTGIQACKENVSWNCTDN